MLVLQRKQYERILIGDIIITVCEIRGDSVKLGFQCPPGVTVYREELWDKIQREGLKPKGGQCGR
jgi:carbon storage regulator